MREGGYRSQEEIDVWKARDPLIRHRQWLLDEGDADEERLIQIETEVQTLVEEAAEFAKNSPWPDGATACDHIFSDPILGEVQHA
jgi:pyruvate dehydrogenase E1 component alpha subunit